MTGLTRFADEKKTFKAFEKKMINKIISVVVLSRSTTYLGQKK
jgi:hypothetical protein